MLLCKFLDVLQGVRHAPNHPSTVLKHLHLDCDVLQSSAQRLGTESIYPELSRDTYEGRWLDHCT